MDKKFYTEVFERIDSEKRQHIIDIAIQEFANKGFKNANINIIAQKAGVSVGSLYKYFETKENLFVTACDFGIRELEGAIKEVNQQDLSFFDKFETLLRVVQRHSRRHPNLHRLYNEITSESYSELVSKVSRSMESLSASAYTGFIEEAKRKGTVASDIDAAAFAWLLDNLLISFQFSYSCDYYRERLKIYLGEAALEDDERLIREMMTFIRRAFARCR